MAATLDSFFGKKDDLRVPYGRGKKPDSEKSVDLRSEERLMSKSPLAEENKLKAVKLCTGDGMKDLENPAPLETLAMDPENKSIISGLFANSKENKDKDRASVKVYTRRVGQKVFWDTKLQRHRTLEELEVDQEICDELREYRYRLWEMESKMDPEIYLRLMGYSRNLGYSGNLRINADNCWDSMELEHPATFEELGMDPENKGIISDFFGFVRANELCKRIGQRAGMLLNLMSDEYAATHLMMEIDALFSRSNNKRIFVFTTNQRDQHDAASLRRPVGMDIYINTPSPLPTSLPDGGKRTYHNSLLVSNSEKENTREAYDSTKGYPLPNFDATENKAVKASRRCLRWEEQVVQAIGDLFLEEVKVFELLLLVVRKASGWGGGSLKGSRFGSNLGLRVLTLPVLFEIIEQLWYHIQDQQIIVLTTNLNHRDRYHTALLSPLNIDAYMHISSPQPIALPDGAEIVQLDSSEKKPLVDFDATNNRAYQRSVFVSNSEKENTRETSKRRCMTESVLSSYDSRTRISLTDFVAPDCRADLVRAYQNGPIMFTLDNKDTREGLNGECLTKSVLSDDDLTKLELLPKRTSLTFSERTSEDLDGFYDSISVNSYSDSDSDSDFDDLDDGARMLPNLKDEFIYGLSSSCGDERITVSTTNHKDPPDAALLPLVNMDTDIHTASPQLVALPDGEEILQLESIEQKSLVDFDATNNRAYQSGVLVSSKKKNTVEAYKEQWESQIQRTKEDMGEGSNEECLTKSALSLDDSTEQNSIDPRRGRGRLHSMEHEQPVTFAELGTDPENEGIVYDLLRNGSLIAIKDFDHWVGMLPNLKNEQLTLSGLLEIIHGLLSSCGDERIIIFITNHNHIDRVDAALLHPLNIDLCLHTSSPQAIAIADGGEIVQLDSSGQKPLEDFDATSNRAYQRDILASNSEGKSTREASRRQCMPDSVLSLVDSMTRISSTDFYALNCSAHLERADQSGPIVFNSETEDSGEGLNRECLTKSVLCLDDSSRQKSLLDVDATKNKAHLVRAYQKGLVVSLSENKNRGEALKRECITRSVLGLGDLQQHFGGRRDDAAKNFGAIYDPGIHTTDSLARKSFKVEETLPIQEQPNDCVPLLSIGKLTLKGWVQEEKSQNLPRVLQLNIVERRVKKLPICLEGLTAESARASCWPISLPDGRHIVVLHPLEQSTKNAAHTARVDQCSPTVSLPEKKMVRKTLKRKCRTMSVTEIHQQHFGRRCEGSAKNFCATCIGGKHVTSWVSTAKRIHRIHQWPFRQEKLDSRFQFIHMSQCVKAGESGPTLSTSEKRSLRDALKRASLRDLQQHFGTGRKDAVKAICDSLAWKSLEVLDNLSLGKHSNSIRHLARRRTLTNKHCVRLKKSPDLPRSLRSDCSGELAAQVGPRPDLHSALGIPDGGHIPSLPEKKTLRKTLKRKSRTMSVLNLEDHQQHVGRRWEDDAKFLGAKRICRQLAIDSRSTEKHILRQHGTRWCQFKQSAIDLPDGGHILSVSKKRIVRKTLKRKCRNMTVLRSEYHQHVDSKWEDAVKSLRAKHIYRQLVSRAKHVCGQHGFHRWPFQPNWATLKGYFLGDKRPVAVISLSMDGKLVSRLQLIHISWLGRFSPRPTALPPGGEIVEPPLALSSSQLPSTSNRAHLGGQDRSSSTTTHSQNERTRDQPEGRKRKIKNLTIEDLRPYVRLTRADAAKKFQMSETTFKRQCRRLKIEQWPKLPPGEEILKPPDPPERNTRQIEMVNKLGHLPNPIEVRKPPDPHERTTRETEMENELVGDFHGPNDLLQDCFDGSICCNIEYDSTTEILETPTVWHYMDMDFIRSATEEIEEARGSHERAFQVIIDELTLSTAYPHPNPVVMQPQVASTHIVSGNIGIPNDQSNSTIPDTMVGSECLSDWSAFFEDCFQEEHVSGFIDCTVPSCSDPAPSQPISTIARTMPEIPCTENEDTGSMELKATYGDTIIKFQLPPMFGISELKEEVSKRREFELGSYKIEYKDVEGDWTLIACNDDIRRYLQQLKSFGKQVIELRVRDEVPITTNSCEFCGSLTRERP
ncbi:hypothetical protein Vadar_001820 [Vaccinium darrowii]|uniref:Uncharacterized protein n=1 Tax=Vaccinium darrowii TaxID=229202 RepID=A0ACB7YB37_9ERIC|nr:hypothetical protein Vadar_001820 [Vaccinium darrowii]